MLHAIISRDGTVQNLTVVSGPPLLQVAATDAVKTWRYQPFLLNGKVSEVDTTIYVNFHLNGLGPYAGNPISLPDSK